MAKTTKTSGPFTAAIMSKLGMITMDTRNIPAPHIVFEHLFKTGLSKINYKSAAEYLQTPESTVRRWYADKKFPSMAVKLMEIKFRGYLPYTKAWKMIYFDLDDNLVTPHGVVTVSDIIMFHQTKWKAETSYKELQRLKKTIDAEFQVTKTSELKAKAEELLSVILAQDEKELSRAKVSEGKEAI